MAKKKPPGEGGERGGEGKEENTRGTAEERDTFARRHSTEALTLTLTLTGNPKPLP